MSPNDIRFLITDFFVLGLEVKCDKIPDLMQWKSEYFFELETLGKNCKSCTQNDLKLKYSYRIKKAIYGR